MKTKAILFIAVAVISIALTFFTRAKLSEKQLQLGTQMQHAVLEKQDLDEIQRILKAGFDINAPIGCGTFNCVDGAVAVGNVNMLKFFLKNGAQPKSSALLQAARCKKPAVAADLVRTLLDAGADAGYKEFFPTNYVTGDTRKPDPTRFTSPLHVACYQGYYEVAQLLLSHRGVALDALDIDGRTPLMWAAEKGNEKIVKLLIEKGADVSIANGRGEWAGSLAQRDHPEIRELIDHAVAAKKLAAAR